MDRPSMRGSPTTLCAPSDSHITTKTQAETVSVDTVTPARAATQLHAPDTTVSRDKTVNTVVARLQASTCCPTLNANLRPNWRRWSRRVSPTPATCTATRAAGSTRYRPATSGRSVRERECESRWSWTCTTRNSLMAKAATQTGHGRSSGAFGPGRSRTTVTNSATAATFSSATKSATRAPAPSRDSTGRAPEVPAEVIAILCPAVCSIRLSRRLSAAIGESCSRSRVSGLRGTSAASASGAAGPLRSCERREQEGPPTPEAGRETRPCGRGPTEGGTRAVVGAVRGMVGQGDSSVVRWESDGRRRV
jgi:hypothetical protein